MADDLGGKVAGAASDAKDAVGAMAEQARSAASDVGDRASDAYRRLKSNAQTVAETVGPFVQDRPYAAIAIAAISGIILGALFFAGGPRVIYVKPPAA